MVGKLQSAFYTNDEQKIEDYLELTGYTHSMPWESWMQS